MMAEKFTILDLGLPKENDILDCFFLLTAGADMNASCPSLPMLSPLESSVTGSGEGCTSVELRPPSPKRYEYLVLSTSKNMLSVFTASHLLLPFSRSLVGENMEAKLSLLSTGGAFFCVSSYNKKCVVLCVREHVPLTNAVTPKRKAEIVRACAYACGCTHSHHKR
jgi:hypothetical protein